MKLTQQALKERLEPFLKVLLSEEKKKFSSELESWESYEAKLRAEFAALTGCYLDRLQHACELVRVHFGF